MLSALLTVNVHQQLPTGRIIGTNRRDRNPPQKVLIKVSVKAAGGLFIIRR